MLFLTKRVDGGPESPVQGYWLIEIKWLFSIVLLKFNPGVRENYHSHAFNALSWFIKGEVEEDRKSYGKKRFSASFIPKYTPRNNLHKVYSTTSKPAWCLSIRGPWAKYWWEFNENTNTYIKLTNGRKIIRKDKL